MKKGLKEVKDLPKKKKKNAGSEFLKSKGKKVLYLVNCVSQGNIDGFKSSDRFSIKWPRNKIVSQNQEDNSNCPLIQLVKNISQGWMYMYGKSWLFKNPSINI